MSGTSSAAITRLREFRRSLGRTPRLHHETVSPRGLQLAVYRTDDPGTGTLPLVCVNGGLLFDHAILWPALAPLARTRQVILYDQRGRGRSSVPPAPHASRIEFDAADLAALPAALGHRRYHLLGHSWGGGISMLSLEHQRDSICSLVLIDPVGLTGDWIPSLTALALDRLGPIGQDRLRAADAAVQPGQPAAADPVALSEYAAALYPAWFADPNIAALFAPPQSTSRTGAAVSARLRRDGYDWRERISPVSMPTLLLHGERDLFPLDMARATTAVLGRNATMHPVPDAGHNPFFEHPSIVFPAIEAFLADAERLTPR